jgi:ELWxxDGT repeat protein
MGPGFVITVGRWISRGLVRTAVVAAVLAAPRLVVAQGTPILVKDISPGATDPALKHLVDVNGTAFFEALSRLWRSDGTASGTFEVRPDVVPQSSTAQQFMPANLNGVLIFGANGPTGHIEPWRSDGTSGGTYMLADANPSGPSHPADFTRVNDVMYFRTSAQFGGPAQLWKTDGTVVGTQLVKDFSISEGAPMNLIAAGSLLFFETRLSNGSVSLWRLDTAGDSPQLLRSFPNSATVVPVPAEGRVADDEMLVIGNTLYLSQYTAAAGVELWKSDRTVAGTQMVADIVSGTSSSAPRAFREVNGRLAFVAGGSQVWTSDGTALNTVNVAPGVSIVAGLASSGQYLLFSATPRRTVDCTGSMLQR